MDTLQVYIKLLHPDSVLPFPATEGAAGYDVYAREEALVYPKEILAVGLGIAMEMPRGMYARLVARSSLNRTGLLLLEGTIDSDYRGELKALLHNVTTIMQAVKAGTRIGQLIFVAAPIVNIKPSYELTPTVRGEGGFGSTGK